jgi:hypothetical protein
MCQIIKGCFKTIIDYLLLIKLLLLGKHIA